MNDIYDSIEEAAKELYIRALKDIPRDVRLALRSGLGAEEREGNETARKVLLTILENIRVADEQDTLVCQDTGLPVFSVRIGTSLQLDGAQVKERLRIGCERATREHPLRSNTVHPLTRKPTHSNTGVGIPAIKFDFAPGESVIEIRMAPKGSGSENMSFLGMLNPADGVKGIRKFVIECVFESGARPCPPVIVGVGLGGTSDVAMSLAKQASCFREIGSENPDPDVAALEASLLTLVNRTGLGPQGLGGATTALAVHVE
jgi:tartrate/fumarate subfamily iron-sulfur-dependent hydro-lyase alpha chain